MRVVFDLVTWRVDRVDICRVGRVQSGFVYCTAWM